MSALAVALGAVGLVVALEAGRVAAEEDGVDSSFYFEGVVACGGSPELAEDPGCHADPESDLVEVTIAGPDFIDEAIGVGAYTVSAMTTIPGQQGAGVNVLIDAASSTSDCELDPFPSPQNDNLVFSTEGAGNVLTHRDATTTPPLGSLGVFSYDFLLINCSVPGNVRILVAMNTYNADGESIGDAWNKTEKTVSVPEPAGSALAALAGLVGAARARRRRA
jgi:MYXO-CTERM domain-containing protein